MILSKLPISWATTTVGEVYQVIGGGTPATGNPDYWNGDTPWITSADIEGVRQFSVRKYVSEKGIDESTTNKVPAKTLLVVTRVGLGKIAITETPFCFSQDLQGLIQKPDFICPEFALYLLSYQLQFLKYEGQGTTISGVTKKQLKDLFFPLPPLNEQHRIVAKIEELFSELDKGIENLKTAQAQLKVYRQALLKHAFEGKLTAQWREQNRDQLETAAALQQRIQQERAQRYQQQLTDWQTNGGSKPKAPKPLPPLTAEELAELPELPQGWGWVRLDEISEHITDGDHQAPPQTKEGIPFITISDIKNQRIDFSDTRYVSKSYFNSLSAMRKPVRDDILYTVTGSFGIPCLIDFDRDFCFQRHIGLIRSGKHISKKFLFYSLCLRHVYGQAAAVATGTAQKTVPLGGLRLFKVPLMSSEEQQQIASELEARLSEVDQLEQTLTTALQQAEALRQSILKRAFSGQLVPQDPHDEPASALLARIKAERATVAAKPHKNPTGDKLLPVEIAPSPMSKES